MSVDLMKSIYPDCVDENYEYPYFSSPYSYQPMLDSIGTILLEVDDEDYSGDSRILYKNGDKYGILIFGWGSCSGCDSLQSSNSYEDLAELYEWLSNSITWMSSGDLLDYVENHDWKGDYSWSQTETQHFVKKTHKILKSLTDDEVEQLRPVITVDLHSMYVIFKCQDLMYLATLVSIAQTDDNCWTIKLLPIVTVDDVKFEAITIRTFKDEPDEIIAWDEDASSSKFVTILSSNPDIKSIIHQYS